MVRRSYLIWRREGKCRRHALKQLPVPRGEHTISFALRVGYAVRGGKIVAVVQDKIDVTCELGLYVFVPGLIISRCMNAPAAGFFDKALKLLDRQSAAQGQRASPLSKAEIQRCETVMQPPSLGPAHRPCVRSLVIKDVNWNYWPVGKRRLQCGMIAYAQIIAQP